MCLGRPSEKAPRAPGMTLPCPSDVSITWEACQLRGLPDGYGKPRFAPCQAEFEKTDNAISATRSSSASLVGYSHIYVDLMGMWCEFSSFGAGKSPGESGLVGPNRAGTELCCCGRRNVSRICKS